MCKVWVGKGGPYHFAFKEQSLCTLYTNQGAVIDENPELYLNQRLHTLDCKVRVQTMNYSIDYTLFKRGSLWLASTTGWMKNGCTLPPVLNQSV